MQIEPKKLPLKQQGYSAAFDMEFLNSSKLKVVFFICYSVPRKIATDSGPKYEWGLVTRDHCTKGCPVSAPLLRMSHTCLITLECRTTHAIKGCNPLYCAFDLFCWTCPARGCLRHKYLFPCRGPYSGPSSDWASWASGPMCPMQRQLTPIRPKTPNSCTCPLMSAAHMWATARPPSSGMPPLSLDYYDAAIVSIVSRWSQALCSSRTGLASI